MAGFWIVYEEMGIDNFYLFLYGQWQIGYVQGTPCAELNNRVAIKLESVLKV